MIESGMDLRDVWSNSAQEQFKHTETLKTVTFETMSGTGESIQLAHGYVATPTDFICNDIHGNDCYMKFVITHIDDPETNIVASAVEGGELSTQKLENGFIYDASFMRVNRIQNLGRLVQIEVAVYTPLKQSKPRPHTGMRYAYDDLFPGFDQPNLLIEA